MTAKAPTQPPTGAIKPTPSPPPPPPRRASHVVVHHRHDAALTACRLLTQWADGKSPLPDGLDVIVGAAWDAILAAGPPCWRPEDTQ